MPDRYEIHVKGHLGEAVAERFVGWAISDQPDGVAVLSGPIVDQATLYGVTNRLRDLGLTLIAVQCARDKLPGDSSPPGS